MNYQFSQNTEGFFPWLKVKSEMLWRDETTDENLKGGYWLPGLTDKLITQYENDIGFTFPEIFKMFLRQMNGTNQNLIVHWGIVDEFGEEPTWVHKKGPGFYSFPRDILYVKAMINRTCAAFGLKRRSLVREGIPHIMPIISNKFLVMDCCEKNPVLSILGNETTPCADSLISFLTDYIFNKNYPKLDCADYKVKFWLD